MIKKFQLSTQQKTQVIDITPQVKAAVSESGVQEGACVVYVPHTTASICIQENADPNVHIDLMNALDRLVPKDLPYLHRTVNKNAPSHIKAALIGTSQTVLIEQRTILLGRYQSIHLFEFDGPRTREVWLRITGEAQEA